MQFQTIVSAVIAQLLLASLVVDSAKLPFNKYVIMDDKVTFFEAWRSCQYYGLQLASVTSSEDNQQLSKLMNRSARGNDTFWLAGTDVGREGKWVWITTNKLVLHFSNWGSISPLFAEVNDCMAIGSFTEDRTLWDDIPCSEAHKYVCQKV
uniref:Putative cpij000440 serine protease n=1 Tax=Aedes albopictus TaxID=7160 RepID=A0A023EGW3_AEDAL